MADNHPTNNRLVNVNTADVNTVGIFTTSQSLVTFPGAVAAVTTHLECVGKMATQLEQTRHRSHSFVYLDRHAHLLAERN